MLLPKAKEILDKEYLRMSQWLPGHYDNQDQVLFEEKRKLDGPYQHVRRGLHIFPVADIEGWYLCEEVAPEEPVADLRRDNRMNFVDPTCVVARSLLHLGRDDERGELTFSTYRLSTDAGIDKEFTSPPGRAFIDIDGVDRQESRQISWRFDGERYNVTEGRKTEGGSLLNTLMTFSDRQLVAKPASDELTTADGSPYILKRGRYFNCYLALVRGHDPNDWQRDDSLLLHDQGGFHWMRRERDGLDVGLRLRLSEYPFGPTPPLLVLHIHTPERQDAVTYCWSEENSERIGINMRWVMALCERLDVHEARQARL